MKNNNPKLQEILKSTGVKNLNEDRSKELKGGRYIPPVGKPRRPGWFNGMWR